MEDLSVKYQIMSKFTSYLCINKNDEDAKPTEELKQVEVVKSKLVYEEENFYHLKSSNLMCCDSAIAPASSSPINFFK